MLFKLVLSEEDSNNLKRITYALEQLAFGHVLSDEELFEVSNGIIPLGKEETKEEKRKKFELIERNPEAEYEEEQNIIEEEKENPSDLRFIDAKDSYPEDI